MQGASGARIVRRGRVDYEPTWRAMIDFSAARNADTADELWLCEHPPVFTLGQAGKPEHVLADIGVPLVQSDRGGQVTYHGPGQVVIYLLLDLNRRRLGIRELVTRIEQSIIDLVGGYGVEARRLPGAPGVYVDRPDGIAKLAALGLRVRRNCTYHGLSLNVDMDLSPFSAINPCGYAGMAVTQLRDLGVGIAADKVAEDLAASLNQHLEHPEYLEKA